MKKNVAVILGVAIVLFIGSEIFLRKYYGFCDTVLTLEDVDYEYIAAPNQNRFRFRNHIMYNSFSMRSNEVDTSALIILGFGDSVINGGVLTDQDSIATTILSDTLSMLFNKKVQFLNISAGSWGPDNCYAYLKKHGNFNAKYIYLFVSSHDAYDNMNFKKTVDVLESFPSHQYKLAIYELIDRYLLPRFTKKFLRKNSNDNSVALGINKKKRDSIFNSGFENFLTYSKATGIPLTIYLHADPIELNDGKYNEQGQEIVDFANKNGIRVIKDLENGLEKNDFRDQIHINEKGQQKLAMTVLKYGLK